MRANWLLGAVLVAEALVRTIVFLASVATQEVVDNRRKLLTPVHLLLRMEFLHLDLQLHQHQWVHRQSLDQESHKNMYRVMERENNLRSFVVLARQM